MMKNTDIQMNRICKSEKTTGTSYLKHTSLHPDNHKDRGTTLYSHDSTSKVHCLLKVI